MSATQSLGLELRFRPDPQPRTWAGVLAAIVAWAPELRPVWALRLADPEQIKLPWSPTLSIIICQACARDAKDGWLLAGAEGSLGAITFARRSADLRCSLALPCPNGDLTDRLFALLNALLPIHGPALAMAFDLTNQIDSELVMQGLSGLTQLPPLLYLDERAIVVLGGAAHVYMAPCEVISAPGGLLLRLRADPWLPSTEPDQHQLAAVALHLGMKPGKPLVLLP